MTDIDEKTEMEAIELIKSGRPYTIYRSINPSTYEVEIVILDTTKQSNNYTYVFKSRNLTVKTKEFFERTMWYNHFEDYKKRYNEEYELGVIKGWIDKDGKVIGGLPK